MLDSRWASIDAFAENNRDNILRDITRLVAVPSVEGTPEPGAPFGKGPKAALDKALEIAAELGLDTHNAEGYIGWAQTGPIADGQKYLATITHTDVVPEGNGWDADPYTVRVRDGWLLGRGVADDKGPSILCLYALKYLKDNGVTLKYPVRALLGANEETNMHDVDYFAAHFEQPAFCFTPDAEFPVCNGEKGGFGGELVSPVLENGVIVDFVGGVAHNAVPDRAACTVRLPESALKQTEGVTFEAGENGTTIIRGWGKSGHAAMPQGTVNAIGLIVTCLLESKVCSPAETSYLQVLHTLHATTDGSALGIAASDDVFDPLTIIGGTIEMKDGRLRQSFDCRYPTSTTAEHLTEMMTQVCGTAATLEDVSSRVPFYIAADSPAIQTLITTYNDVTGENKKPFTMGGGTYARHFPSINWLTSYSEYADDLRLWYDEHVGPEFVTCRHQMAHLLQKESELMEIVKLIGADILPEDQKLIIETAKLFRVGFLQQNAYHPIDTYVPLDKQLRMMELMLKLYHGAKDIVSRAIPLSQLKETGIFESLAKMKYEVPNDGQEKFAEYDAAIEDALRQVNEANR